MGGRVGNGVPIGEDKKRPSGEIGKIHFADKEMKSLSLGAICRG